MTSYGAGDRCGRLRPGRGLLGDDGRHALGVGSRLDFVARFLGRTLAYTYEVVEYGPDRLVMRTAQGPFKRLLES